MKHFLLKFSLVIASLIVGVGCMWAEDFKAEFGTSNHNLITRAYTDATSQIVISTTETNTSASTYTGIGSNKTVSVQIPAGVTVTRILFSATGTAYPATGFTCNDNSTLSDDASTGATAWSGSATNKTLVFTNSGTKTARLKSMTITFTSNSGGGNSGDGGESGSQDGNSIIITAESVTDFSSAYNTYSWEANNVSGKMFAYKGGSSGSYNMQFNKNSAIYNTTPVPGKIKSVKMIKVAGNDRAWSVYVSSSPLTSTTNATNLNSTAQTVGVNGYTWNVTSGDYTYFYITKDDGGTNIGEIVITYENTQPTAETPVISPANGTEFSTATKEVSISAADGATIYYTLDGTTPDDAKTLYEGAFNISATTTIKAIAYETDKRPSAVASATITYVAPITTYDINCNAPVGGTYTVKVGNEEAQTITAATVIDGGEGKTITLTTTPSTGYKLASTPFTVKDADEATVSVSKSGDNYTFTMPSKAVTITANYSPVYAITAADGIVGGTISFTDKDDKAITETSLGSKVKVVVTPATGYELATLTYNKVGEEPTDIKENKYFTMPGGAVTVTATFSKINYTITYADDLTGGSVSGATTAYYGDEVTLTATPAEGYAFGGWNVTDASSNAVTITDNKFTMPAANVTVSASFRQFATVTLSENGVSTNLSGTHYVGEEVTLPTTTTATVPAGKTFMGWSEAAVETTNDKPAYLDKGATYTITGATKTFYAVYATEDGTGDPNILTSVSGTITSGDYYLVDTYDGVDASNNTAPRFWAVTGRLSGTGGATGGFNSLDVSSYSFEDDGKLSLNLTGVESNKWPTLYTLTIDDDGVSISMGSETYYCTGTNVNADMSISTTDTYNWTRIVEGTGSYSNRYSIEVDHGTGQRCLLFQEHTSTPRANRLFKNQSRNNRGAGGTQNAASFSSGYFYLLQAGSASYTKYTTTVSTATITLNAACHDTDGMVYSTYSNASAWVVPSNLEVSEVGVVDGKLVVESYKTSDVVPANTGVMVSATEGGNYSVDIETDPETLELAESVLGEGNCLRPSDADGITAEQMAAADADCKYYRLTMHNGTQIGFWWGAADGAAFSLAANKAYLAVPNSVSLTQGMWFGDNLITGLNTIMVDSNATRYDLQGRVVGKATKGIQIMNGRKVIR